jgi:hypothetical protein
MADGNQEDRRERTAVVQLKIRMREALRARLEEEANTRGVSINAEVVDRLQRTFEHQDLLPEVLTLAYSNETAGLLIMLGSVMNDAGHSHLDARRSRYWVGDPAAYEQAVLAGITLLNATRRHPKYDDTMGKLTDRSVESVRNVIIAIRKRSVDPSRNPFSRYTRSVATIRSLLGPIAKRLNAFNIRGSFRKHTRDATPQLKESDCWAFADEVLQLINSSPRTPSREEITGAIFNQLQSLTQRELKS